MQMIEYTSFIHLWNEFFMSTSDECPGNYLFGEFDKAHSEEDSEDMEELEEGVGA